MQANINQQQPQIDVTEPDIVQVQVSADGKVLWINVNGICMFRACKIAALVIDDERQSFFTGQVNG